MSETQRISIGKVEDFQEEKLYEVKAMGQSYVVGRVGDRYCAATNVCPHLNLPLAGGKFSAGVLECPWHNSVFDLCSGKNQDWVRGLVGIRLPDWSRDLVKLGRQPADLTTFNIVEENGELFIEV
ncbi:MAG: Rieske 2Fe-2S domain-containing protein [Chloroflexi bacterium]|nr:Rieske 2Fe-2S domain-containing protein [Chloroflexota bacterium]